MARLSRFAERLRWRWRHYPRVPEGRDSFLMRLYDRWHAKATPAGRNLLGAFFLLFAVEMLPGISPAFPLLMVFLFLLLFDFVRGGRRLKRCEIRPEGTWTLGLGEEKRFRLSWSRERADGEATAFPVRVPDGLLLLERPGWSADAAATGSVLLRGRRRGKWTLDHLRLAQRGGAFLLDRWSAPAKPPVSVLVEPLPLPVEAVAPVRERLESYMAEEFGVARREGGAGEFRNIREYRPGDPVRSVHARSSARFAQPMVRVDEESVPAGTAAVVVVDPTARTIEERMSFEAMVSLALGLAAAFERRGVAARIRVLGRGGAADEEAGDPERRAELLAAVRPARPGAREPARRDAALPGAHGWLLAVRAGGRGPAPAGWKFLRVDRGGCGPAPAGWDSVDSSSWGVPDP